MQTIHRTKLLVITLDACDKDLVYTWAMDGSLPTFRHLFETSLQCETRSPPGFFGGTVWSSFATGLSPAGHGRFCAVQTPRGAYEAREFPPSAIDGKPFWQRASEAGQRVAIIDVPLSTPAHRLNGLQVVDYMTHDQFYSSPQTYPPTLIEELHARFGLGRPDVCEASAHLLFRRSGVESLVDELLRRIKTKGELSRHYLRQGGWDLFLTSFAESHCVGHQCWHLHDPSHPLHDRTLAAEVGDPVKRIYQALDSELAALLAAAGPGVPALVWLSHGMGPMTKAHDTVLEEILLRLQPQRPSWRSRLFQRLKLSWYRVPPPLRRWPVLKSLRYAVAPQFQSALSLPDRHRRPFYSVPADTSVGAVRLSVAGREAGDRVSAGREYRSVIDGLRRDLAEIVDPGSGAPLIRAVYVPADLFHGPHLDDLPDLLLEWNHDSHFDSVSSQKIGVLEVSDVVGRTGEHRNAGLLFGLDGLGTALKLKQPMAVEDLTCTICDLLDVPADGIEGRPRDEFRMLRRPRAQDRARVRPGK